MDEYVENLIQQAKGSTGFSSAPNGYLSVQSVPLLLEAILIKLTEIAEYQRSAGLPVDTTDPPVDGGVRLMPLPVEDTGSER